MARDELAERSWLASLGKASPTESLAAVTNSSDAWARCRGVFFGSSIVPMAEDNLAAAGSPANSFCSVGASCSAGRRALSCLAAVSPPEIRSAGLAVGSNALPSAPVRSLSPTILSTVALVMPARVTISLIDSGKREARVATPATCSETVAPFFTFLSASSTFFTSSSLRPRSSLWVVRAARRSLDSSSLAAGAVPLGVAARVGVVGPPGGGRLGVAPAGVVPPEGPLPGVPPPREGPVWGAETNSSTCARGAVRAGVGLAVRGAGPPGFVGAAGLAGLAGRCGGALRAAGCGVALRDVTLGDMVRNPDAPLE